MARNRYFDNPYEDYSEANTLLDRNSCELNVKTKEFLTENIRKLLKYFETNVNKSIDSNDYSVYTGSTGYVLLYMHLSQVFKDSNLLDKCQTLLDPIVKRLRLRREDISFILGDSGVLAISSVLHQMRDNRNECNKTLSALKSMVRFTAEANSGVADELLYGRTGFLYSLLFVQKYVQNCQQIIDKNDIRAVVDAIIRSGLRTAQRENASQRCPLMYYWYKTSYVGAAHGLIGIMAMLLEAKTYLTDEELDKYVKPTVDFILSIRMSSGNYPSDLDDSSDLLVHWCHGCPGAVHMFSLAYLVFKDERYLMAAKDSCEWVWKRGLLTKGYGLCHGTAGNGYAFLRLYQLTKEPKYLYRAVRFGEWCCHYGEHGCRTPDRPFSLFEGLAGTLYYLSDLLDPNNSRFPAYQLS